MKFKKDYSNVRNVGRFLGILVFFTIVFLVSRFLDKLQYIRYWHIILIVIAVFLILIITKWKKQY